MIKEINGFNFSRIPFCQGQDSTTTQSSTNTVLSSVFVDASTFNAGGDGIRIKTLFRKGTLNNTAYDVSLYWNTGTTLNVSAVKLASVSVSGSSSVVGIERNIRFYFTLLPSVDYTVVMNTSTSLESDIGAIGSNAISEITTLPFNSAGYYMACAQRTTLIGRSFDDILCSYIYIESL